MLKVNSSATEQWFTRIGRDSNSIDPSIFETPGGDFIVQGIYNTADSSRTVFLDKYGKEIPARNESVHFQGNDASNMSGKPVTDTISTMDGGILSFGVATPEWKDPDRSTWSDIMLSRYDRDGNLLWKTTVTRTHFVNIISVIQTHDDGFVVLGYELVTDPSAYARIPSPTLPGKQ